MCTNSVGLKCRIRFGRMTFLDAGEKAQLVCGALYTDCMTNAPPLLFDVIFLGKLLEACALVCATKS